jgi:hypothetical protein
MRPPYAVVQHSETSRPSVALRPHRSGLTAPASPLRPQIALLQHHMHALVLVDHLGDA